MISNTQNANHNTLFCSQFNTSYPVCDLTEMQAGCWQEGCPVRRHDNLLSVLYVVVPLKRLQLMTRHLREGVNDVGTQLRVNIGYLELGVAGAILRPVGEVTYSFVFVSCKKTISRWNMNTFKQIGIGRSCFIVARLYTYIHAGTMQLELYTPMQVTICRRTWPKQRLAIV